MIGMAPRPAPDLDLRREQIARTARRVAEAEGWEAVTMRRLAGELGVTQPVLYSAFPGGRQALVDAVALAGFDAISEALEAVEAEPRARLRAYLDFARSNPRVYEAMFSLPSGLSFGTGEGPAPLRRAFAAIRAAVVGHDEVEAEVLWATVHGLAALETSRRLPATRADARLEHASAVLGSDARG